MFPRNVIYFLAKSGPTGFCDEIRYVILSNIKQILDLTGGKKPALLRWPQTRNSVVGPISCRIKPYSINFCVCIPLLETSAELYQCGSTSFYKNFVDKL